MIALLDIGNTRFKYVHYLLDEDIKGSIVEEQCYSAIISIDNQELTSKWLTEHLSNITHLVFANVNDQRYSEILKNWAISKSIPFKIVGTEKSFNNVINGYTNFGQMGVDRWLALVGAKQMFPTDNCLIIDSGTATTFDVLDAQGSHHGGWILPGIELMTNSVLESTANVKGSATHVENIAFGKSTSDNLSYASWAATVGAVEQAIKLANDSGDKPSRVIFTGGNGKLLMQHCEVNNDLQSFSYVEKLIFIGLACYIAQ
ncbi:type III pantothenate kinase [Thalassotalea atypica]|uniref:type III pantothenate kinase n=1 Tax=Thalassotalea atypica TaxID=2054316 RepID=UPI002573D599|nr:type III pantothenate kinase [Thalassotalea atypica]